MMTNPQAALLAAVQVTHIRENVPVVAGSFLDWLRDADFRPDTRPEPGDLGRPTPEPTEQATEQVMGSETPVPAHVGVATGIGAPIEGDHWVLCSCASPYVHSEGRVVDVAGRFDTRFDDSLQPPS